MNVTGFYNLQIVIFKEHISSFNEIILILKLKIIINITPLTYEANLRVVCDFLCCCAARVKNSSGLLDKIAILFTACLSRFLSRQMIIIWI